MQELPTARQPRGPIDEHAETLTRMAQRAAPPQVPAPRQSRGVPTTASAIANTSYCNRPCAGS